MAKFGYTMICEQSRPDQLAQDIQGAERAGFDEVALVQIGADAQEQFFPWAENELLPALRSL